MNELNLSVESLEYTIENGNLNAYYINAIFLDRQLVGELSFCRRICGIVYV